MSQFDKAQRILLKSGGWIERGKHNFWLYHASGATNRVLDQYLESELAEQLFALSAGQPKVYQCPRCCTAMEVDPSAKPSGQTEERLLTRPAMVGNTRFGFGVKWSTVIARAEREYEYQVTPEKEAARMAKVRSFVQAVGNIANPDKQSAPNAEAPISWGHEQQNYPGGPIYRVGTSTGVSAPSHVEPRPCIYRDGCFSPSQCQKEERCCGMKPAAPSSTARIPAFVWIQLRGIDHIRDEGQNWTLSVAAVRALIAAAQSAPSASAPTLPKARGIGRNRDGSIELVFQRNLTDDEMRDLHDWINGRYPAAYDTLQDSRAPWRKRT